MKMRKSFTLIELLIVITIIGILAVALVPRISQGPARARDVQRKADLQQLATAMELYYADHGEYPNSGGGVPENFCVSSMTSYLGSYLSLPGDPGNGKAINCSDDYYYKVFPYSASGSTPSAYVLIANMENPANTDNFFCTTSQPSITNGDSLEQFLAHSTYGDPTTCPTDYAYYYVYH